MDENVCTNWNQSFEKDDENGQKYEVNLNEEHLKNVIQDLENHSDEVNF